MSFNKFKATTIYGSLKNEDYIVNGEVLDAGVITCKDINCSTNITITSAILPTTENSSKVATTAFVKNVVADVIDADEHRVELIGAAE